MKALTSLTHHHHPPPSTNYPPPTPTLPPPTLHNRALIAAHFQHNQPPLPLAHFTSFASPASALAHGVPHPPEPTYFPLILSPPFSFARIQNIIRTQIPELEGFEAESARVVSAESEEEGRGGRGKRRGERGTEEEVEVVRIRGSVRGWWTVLQGVLDDDEGGAYFLQRVPVVCGGREVQAYRATLHFARG